MNRALSKALLIFLGAFMLQSGIAHAQAGAGGNASTSNSFVIKNTAGQKITFGIPNSGVTDYTLTFPSVAGGAGSLLYSTNATGTLGWLTAGSNGQVLSLSGGALTWVTPTNGTVTSVALAMPSIFTVSGSPLTTSGTLTAALAVQAPNLVFAGPSSGVVSVAPTFRALVAADIPNLDASKITTGLLSVARGGTGLDGSTAANGRILIGNGTGYSLANITAGSGISVTNGAGTISIAATNSGTVTSVGLTMPTGFTVANSPITSSGTLAVSTTLNGLIRGNGTGFTTGTVALGTEVTGTLSIANGGTGGTTAITALNNLLPTQTGNGTKFLTTDGTNASWATVPTGTVTSVGLAMPSIFSVTNSPVTTSGTLTASLATQTAATVFAGPVTGVAAAPTFRALAATDIPSLAGSYIVNGTSQQASANYNISGNGCLAGQLQLKGTSTGLTSFQAGAQGVTNINYTLPITAPVANQVLISSGGASSNLSWTDASSLLSGSYWGVNGNSIVTSWAGASGNYLGTTSAQPVVIAATNATAQDIKFFSGASGAKERVRILGSNGFVGIGTFPPVSILNVACDSGDIKNDFVLDGYNGIDPTDGAEIRTRRARGTIASPANIQNGDDLGGFKFTGYFGGAFVSSDAVQFDINVDGTPTASNIPASIDLNTNDGTGIQNRIHIAALGNVGVSVSSPNTKLDIDGGVSHRPSTATFSANGSITVGNRSYIRITHSANNANFTMTLSDGLQDGQILVIQCEGVTASRTFTFADGGNLALSGNYVPNTNHSTISLIWDGTEWVETARSLN